MGFGLTNSISVSGAWSPCCISVLVGRSLPTWISYVWSVVSLLAFACDTLGLHSWIVSPLIILNVSYMVWDVFFHCLAFLRHCLRCPYIAWDAPYIVCDASYIVLDVSPIVLDVSFIVFDASPNV